MSKYIKKFDTFAEYEAYSGSSAFVRPNFSYVVSEDETYYDGEEKRYYSNWMDVGPFTATSLTDLRGYITKVKFPDDIGGAVGNNLMPYFINMESVELPSGVTSLGYQTFLGCTHLKEVTMPDEVSAFSYSTFAACTDLKRINSDVDGVFNLPTALTTVGSAICRNCNSVQVVNIPGTLANTNTHAFSACTGLVTANFESGTTTISTSCFQGCTNLKDVVLPDGLKTIGQDAFSGCNKLSGITIPDSVTSIGIRAFNMCQQLKEVVVPSGVTTTSNQTFSGCTNLTALTLSENITSIASAYCRTCTNLREIVIPDKVTTIGNQAFCACSNLSAVTFGAALSSFGTSVFDSCFKLKRVNSNVDGLFILPSQFKTLGQTSFYANSAYCSNVIISNSLTSIGNRSFDNCRALKNVHIGTGVTTVGASGFARCTTIQSITIRKTTPPTCGANLLSGASASSKIYVPAASVATYKATAGWSTYASRIEAIPHPYVNLDLPSGALWSTLNVGATVETDYGDYYQYGKGADDYQVTSADTPYDGTEDPLYTSADTAAQLWGGFWHIPTKDQIDELIEYTNFEWVTDFNGSGVNGAKFTSKVETNLDYLFIPAAGTYDGGSLLNGGTLAAILSTTPNGPSNAYGMEMTSTDVESISESRAYGLSVRPIMYG